MYIEIHKYKEMEQKVLYFKINNALNMDCLTELNKKFKGIYAIYKDDLCLYVGQTANFASRSATHLRGKYQNATHIYFWNIEDIGFSDFEKRPKEIQRDILNNCEKYYMSKLKPIDNIDIDMDFKLPKNETPIICGESVTIENHKLSSSLFIYSLIAGSHRPLLLISYLQRFFEYPDLLKDGKKLLFGDIREEFLKLIPDFRDKLFKELENEY